MKSNNGLRLGIFAFCVAGMAMSASAQVNPIGPFTGTRQEGFQVIGQWPPNGPCTFCPSIPDAFGGICTLMSVGGGNDIHVTGGWGFVCSISANFTPRLAASTGGGGFDYVFAPGQGAGKFGGYFGTNSGVAGGTIEFYDANNVMIGSDVLNHQADCQWVWHGWEFDVPVERIRVIGNYSGGGYVMMDDMEYDETPANPNAIGACCYPNGTCDFITLANCLAGGGSFQGENVTCAAANCQPQVACCFFTSCTMLTAANCTAQGGSPLAVGTTCATANCPTYEFVENLAGVFTDISTTGVFITSGDDSSAPFVSNVTNALITNPNLWASTNGVISSNQFTAYFNTALPAGAAGLALFPFWDDLFADPAQNGAIYHEAVVENGINVHIIQWENVRTYEGGPGSATGRFQVKIFESGPAIAQFIYDDVAYPGTSSSNGASATIGFQLNGSAGNNLEFSMNSPTVYNGAVVSLVPAGGNQPCYANCDGSTVEPVLNVDDFTCFINEFAAAQALPHEQQVTHYANCDNSTVAPALNVDDFTCFINEFAQGCP